jgi:hypothetical protein
VQRLRDAVPELEGLYRERVKFWKGERVPSNYEVFGSVLRPKLNEDLEKGQLTEFLWRAALFMEAVCTSGDPEAINVAWIEIFEWLIYKPKELDLLWPTLGPTTRKNIKDAAQRWSEAGRHFGRTANLPVNNLPKE